MTTQGQAAMERQAAELEPGSLRHQVLTCAQKFKSSWIELGAMLVKVRDQGAWGEWGFKSFEEYCAKELRIKRQTALKLTNSYSFLARHEKSYVEAAEHPVEKAPPPFEVVSVLADAQDRGQLSERDYQDLRDKIWGDEAKPAQLVRELAERFPAPPKPAPAPDVMVRRLATAARRLAGDLADCPKIPKAVAERADALAADVEELVRASREESPEA